MARLRSWALLCALLMTATMFPAVGSHADEPAGPRVVAADGTVQAITAIDPSNRTAGLFALYTPEFGTTTKTNQWGGEAVVRPAGDTGHYEVVDVCTAFDDCSNAGDNAIPDDGYVLSAAPGGTPDVRLFLRDHVAVGDVVQILGLKVRSATTVVDATDPTAESNPDGVDPATGECYPGCRGAEQLIVYTPEHGERTGTNDYGYEVDVVDGRVVDRGGNNREIPADGIVLSGHGGRGSWLSSNAIVGAKVTFDGDEVTVTIDADTYLYNAQVAVDAAGRAITTAGQQCVDAPLDQADIALDEATTLLTEAHDVAADDPDAAIDLAEQAADSAAVANYRTVGSRPVEGRGMWVRPTETSPDDIAATLDRLETAGVNVVFLETVWQGYTIYPSAVAESYGITPQRPEMAGFDPLEVWIEQAHERGIELHAWVHTFFVGSEAANGGPGPVLTEYPEWAAVEREDVGAEGPQPSSREPGYYFVDPAIPGARTYVSSVFDEMLTGYDLDGLHLDYIRYPVSEPWETAAFSYSDYARQAFADEHGVDPFELTPDDELWETWSQWREHQITSFVQQVRDMQRSVAPQTAVSAAVFPDPADGLVKKFQNWADWVDLGLMDFLTGMSFGTSGESVAKDTAAMRETVEESSLLYTATYGPFRSSAPDVVVEQVEAVRDAGSDGAALFAYNQLSDAQAEALNEGPFRQQATAPHSDLIGAAQAGVEYTDQRVREAAGTCVPWPVYGTLKSDLVLADTWLDQGEIDRAAAALARAVDGAGDAGIQAGFGARLVRDLETYLRWVERAQQLSS